MKKYIEIIGIAALFTNKTGEVVGFYSFSTKKFEEIYVAPKFRFSGVSDFMLNHWKENFEMDCKVVCNHKSKQVFLNNGFKLKKEFTNWFHLTYDKEK
jgi:diketogulonate reductase-like aldo/keto reductase